MKKTFFLILSFGLLTQLIWADIEIDQQDMGSERISQPAKRSPFSFDTHVDVIGPSKINKGWWKGNKIDYAEAEAEVGMVVFYCPEHIEGVRVACAFTPAYLKWHDNPWFDQCHFNIFKISLSGFSKRYKNWFLRAQYTTNLDANKWSNKYTSYDTILWGRYEYSRDVGLHIGVLAQTGLKMNYYYPIIGFDWQISKKVKLNLIAPVNVSLNYLITPRFSIGIAGRFFSPRYRVHHDDYSHKPLVRYTNIGSELILQYENESMTANIHAGYTLWGRLRIANVHNRDARYYYLNSAAYAGASMNVKF